VDEIFVGGKRKIRRDGAKYVPMHGRPGKDSNKTIVFGMVERNGDIITRIVRDATHESLIPLIEKHVAKGSDVSSDQWKAYKILCKKGYNHEYVNHSIEEWVRGDTHTNTLEVFWSHFKNSVRGTHKSISRKHMMNYLHQFEFRFNFRRDVSGAMFDRLLQAF
jgi:transposase-like protein